VRQEADAIRSSNSALQEEIQKARRERVQLQIEVRHFARMESFAIPSAFLHPSNRWTNTQNIFALQNAFIKSSPPLNGPYSEGTAPLSTSLGTDTKQPKTCRRRPRLTPRSDGIVVSWFFFVFL
jgi:hypothetical protein